MLLQPGVRINSVTQLISAGICGGLFITQNASSTGDPTNYNIRDMVLTSSRILNSGFSVHCFRIIYIFIVFLFKNYQKFQKNSKGFSPADEIKDGISAYLVKLHLLGDVKMNNNKTKIYLNFVQTQLKATSRDFFKLDLR